MDYKKIFKTPKSREIILNMMRFVPDNIMLKFQYKIKTGRKLDLKHPKRFTEKIQWYKLYYRNPVLKKCVDKYQVREYIQAKGFGDILVNLLVKCNSIEEVNWDVLPKSFVIKTTNGGGGLNVVVCHNKDDLNKEDISRKLKCKELKTSTGGREWAYYGLQPGIVIEELLINRDNPKAGINDYKIFCFNGEPKYIIVDVDRYTKHKRNFYDIDWNNLYITSDCPASDREIERPQNFSKMLEIARELSKDFPYVRVDLYNVNGKIYFGELTFYPWSGYVQFEPDEFDYILGENFKIP